MQPKRRKTLVLMAIDYLDQHWEDANFLFGVEDEDDLGEGLQELEVGSKKIFEPTAKELEILAESGSGGNWRTRQIIELALTFVSERVDDLDCEYPSESENENHYDTHLTFEGYNFRKPTHEEFEGLLGELDSIVKGFPPIPNRTIAWDVFDFCEEEESFGFETSRGWIDTVFFSSDCDRDYVKRSLIDHDGYNSSIAIRAKELVDAR